MQTWNFRAENGSPIRATGDTEQAAVFQFLDDLADAEWLDYLPLHDLDGQAVFPGRCGDCSDYARRSVESSWSERVQP